jgi:flagellar hook-length control protein FliK
MQTSSLQPSPLTTFTPAASSKGGNSVNEADPAGSSFQDTMTRQLNKATVTEQQPASAQPEANTALKPQNKPVASVDKAAAANKETQQAIVASADEADTSATADALNQTNLNQTNMFLALANGVKDANDSKDANTTKDAKHAETDQATDIDANKVSELLGATVTVAQPPLPLATPAAATIVVASQPAADKAAPAINAVNITSVLGPIVKTDIRDTSSTINTGNLASNSGSAVDTEKPKAQPANANTANRELPAALTQNASASAANKQATALVAPATSAVESKPEMMLAMHGTEKSVLPDSAAKLSSDAIQTSSGVFSMPAQASVPTAANAVASANEIKAAPGSPAWDQAVGNKIVWMVGNTEQSASLTLNPPDLGPLQVIIKMQNDQASATFISAHHEVRQALEAAIPTLRNMMNDAGISLGQTTINMGNPQQQNFQDTGNGQAANQTADMTSEAMTGLSSSAEPPLVKRVSSGLVDTFA